MEQDRDVWDKGTYRRLMNTKTLFDKQIPPILKREVSSLQMKGRKPSAFHQWSLKAWQLVINKHRDKYATDEEYNSEDYYAKKSSLKYNLSALWKSKRR